MTDRDAFVLGVTTYCKTAALDAEDTCSFVELLLDNPETATALVERAKSDPKMQRKAADMEKDAIALGGLGIAALAAFGPSALSWGYNKLFGKKEEAGAGRAAYDKYMSQFNPEQQKYYGPMLQRRANEAARTAMEASLTGQQRKDLGFAPAGRNSVTGSAAQPNALIGGFMSRQTGLDDKQMSSAIDRANARRGAGRGYRRHMRQLGLAGTDISSLTPESMQAAGFSPENISMVQGAQKYRGQARSLAGGRGFSQIGGGFGSGASGAQRPIGGAPAMQAETASASPQQTAAASMPSSSPPTDTQMQSSTAAPAAPVPPAPSAPSAVVQQQPPAPAAPSTTAPKPPNASAAVTPTRPSSAAASSSPRPTSLLSGGNSFVQQNAKKVA